LEIDLIEEIGRVLGFSNIPSSLPAAVPQIRACETRDLVSVIKNTLVALGLNEVITYSLVDKESQAGTEENTKRKSVEILNPLSQQQAVLRNTLVASLIRCIATNLNQKQDYVNIFEVAKIFSDNAPQPKEELFLGIALCGIKPLFLEQGLIRDKIGILHFKGILEALFSRLGIKDYHFTVENAFSAAVYIKEERIGLIVVADRDVLDTFGIKSKEVIAGEFSLENILPCVDLKKQFVAPAVYPGIARDISLILKERIPVGDVLASIKENGASLLKEAKIADYYIGKQIPPGFRGLTIACVYRCDERTLTEEEVNPVHSSILRLLPERFGAQIR